MIKRLLLALILMAAPALATTTQVIGTLIDSSGTPINGTACFKLPVNAVDTSTNRALSPQPICFQVTNGTFPAFANLVPNDVIQPLNTYYQTRVTNRSGGLVFMANYVIITGGGTFNIGLAIPTIVTTTSISYLTPLLANGNNVLTGNNTFTGNNVFSGGSNTFAGTFVSSNSTPVAQSGFVRLGNSDSVVWRNVTNTTDVFFKLSGAASGNIPADTFLTVNGSGGMWMSFYSSANTTASLTGVLRGGTTDSLACWRNNGNSADMCLSKNPSDELVWNATSGGIGGFRPGVTAFASLGTPASGILIYCSDCTIANPCAGGGTGAIAKRLNGVWVCN